MFCPTCLKRIDLPFDKLLRPRAALHEYDPKDDPFKDMDPEDRRSMNNRFFVRPHCSMQCFYLGHLVRETNQDCKKFLANLSAEENDRLDKMQEEVDMIRCELKRLRYKPAPSKRPDGIASLLWSEEIKCINIFLAEMPRTSLEGLKAWIERGYAFHSAMQAELKYIQDSEAW